MGTLCAVNKKEQHTVSEKWFVVLFILVWTKQTVFLYVEQVVKRLPLFYIIAEYIYPIAIGFSLLFAFPYMLKKIKSNDIILYCIGLISILLSYFCFPNAKTYIEEEALRIFFVTIVYFIGVCVDFKSVKTSIYWASLLGIFIAILYRIYWTLLGRGVIYDAMGEAYNLLPSTLYVGYYALNKKKLIHWLAVVPGILLLFFYGTRGPILCMLVFFVGAVFVLVKNKKTTKNFILALFILILIMILLFSTGLMTNLMIELSALAKEWGVSSRIFDYYLNESLMDDSGRSFLSGLVKESIIDKPIFGCGIMGDRYILDGSYVHNIFLEIWCQFGVILGSGILISLFVVLLKPLFLRIDVENKLFIFMFISMVIPKLMLTGSYLHESNLFFLLGMCISLIRQKRKI